jgi:hypothetical protein
MAIIDDIIDQLNNSKDIGLSLASIAAREFGFDFSIDFLKIIRRMIKLYGENRVVIAFTDIYNQYDSLTQESFIKLLGSYCKTIVSNELSLRPELPELKPPKRLKPKKGLVIRRPFDD